MSLHIENNIFAELTTKYSTWNELQGFLESEEGGQFRVVDTADNGLNLIRYEKGTTNMNLPHSRWFRSVVWNTHTNRPVSIAPPKTTTTDFPFTTIQEIEDSGTVCQELLDGFMINCFRMADDENLYITSRSKLNAAGKFYSSKSFRQLFIESFMETCGSTEQTETAIQSNSLLRSPDRSKNEIAIFYSFLVQHKDHRIVKKIKSNHVYLIHSGTVFDDARVELEDSPKLFDGKPNMECLRFDKTSLKGSWAEVLTSTAEEEKEKEKDTTTNEIQSWIKNVLANKAWDFQGVVFKNSMGDRWRFRSEKYSLVKTLRGNSPTMRERFAQLYTQNLVYKYLEYYTEDMIIMTVHSMLANTIITILYNAYVDLHIKKTTEVSMIDKMYLPHLYNLHGIYLSQMRPSGLKMTLADVQLYFTKLPWQRIVFLIKKVNDQLSTLMP